jgi:hypothetical protein
MMNEPPAIFHPLSSILNLQGVLGALGVLAVHPGFKGLSAFIDGFNGFDLWPLFTFAPLL